MTDSWAENGRVQTRFGSLDNHQMDREWGWAMAAALLENNAAGFGRALAKGKISMQDIPDPWLEAVLTNWRETAPSEFGKALAKVVTDGAGRGR